MLKLVSLDLDGTLIHPAIFNVVADALGFGAPLEKSYQAYLDGSMTLEEAFHHDYQHFVGRDVASMHEVLRESASWTPGIASAIDRFHEAGLAVMLTTDQPRFLAEVTLRFGVDHLACSESDTRHGRVSADITPAFEKWPNLHRHLRALGIEPAEVAHVGNGTNDIPVFRHIGHAVAVNALDPSVEAAAKTVIRKLHDLNEVADALLS